MGSPSKAALLIAPHGAVGAVIETVLDRREWRVARSKRLADAAFGRHLGADVTIVVIEANDDFRLLRAIVRSIDVPILVLAPALLAVDEGLSGLHAACLQLGAPDVEALVDAAEMLRARSPDLARKLPLRIRSAVTKWSTRLRGPHIGRA